MNWLLRIMELFASFFIVVTGVLLIPQVAKVSSTMAFIYAISTMLSSIYFSWLGISERFVSFEQTEVQK